MRSQLVATVLVFVLAGTAAAQSADRFPPEYTWVRLETRHFDVLFPREYEAAARAVAAHAEDAWEKLTPLFGHEPDGRVVVIVNDGQDRHNGYATVHPKPTIEIELMPPDTRSTIYGPDYIRQIVFHEFAHILQLDATDGFRGVMRDIFGDPLPVTGGPLGLLISLLALPPNTAAPTWFLEGGAQWAETEYGSWGRGRTAYTSALLRAAVMANKTPDADEAVLAYPDWPYGTATYLWGIAFCREVQWRYGKDSDTASVPGSISRDGANGFPGLFEFDTSDETDRNATGLFAQAMTVVRDEQLGILETIRRQPVTQTRRLTPPKLIAWGPTVTADGRTIFFVGSPPDQRTALYRIDADGSIHRLGVRLSSQSRLFLDPKRDGRLYFTRIEPDGVGKNRINLYNCDFGGGDVEHVVKDRVTEVAPMADGGWLRVRQSTDRDQVFHTLGFHDENPSGLARGVGRSRDLVAPLVGHSPVPMSRDPEHQTLRAAVVELTPGRSRVTQYDSRGRMRVLAETRAEILDLARGPLGELYFVCGEGGVLNIWMVDPADETPTPVCLTNTETAFLELAPTRDGVIAVSLDVDGPHLVFVPDGELVARPAPQGLRLQWPTMRGHEIEEATTLGDGESFTIRQRQTAEGEADPDEVVEDDEDLPSYLRGVTRRQYGRNRRTLGGQLGALRPHFVADGLDFHYWLPFVDNGTYSFTIAGATVAFADPLNRLSFNFTGGWNFDISRPLGLFSLVQREAEWEFTWRGSFTSVEYDDRVETFAGQRFDYTEDIARSSFRFAQLFPGLDDAWRLGGEVHFEYRQELKAENSFPAGPYASPPAFTGMRLGLELFVSYDSRTYYPRSVGAEGGIYGSAAFLYRPPLLREKDHEFGLRGVLGASISLPWDGQHLLLLEARGGWGNAPASLQGLFDAGGPVSAFPSRGYSFADQTGRRALAGSVAYRFPLIQIYRGPWTLPIHFRALAIEVFADAASAFDRASDLRVSDFLTSVGAELRFEMAINGAYNFTARVGYAYASEIRPASDRHVAYLVVGIPGF